MSDEMRIQFTIDEFYEITKRLENDQDKIRALKLLRNIAINMMDTYLKKYDNQMIMKDFYTRLTMAKTKATVGNKINKYQQYMNEIRVIQEFKGIDENIAEKLAEQLFEQWKQWADDNPEIGYYKDDTGGKRT